MVEFAGGNGVCDSLACVVGMEQFGTYNQPKDLFERVNKNESNETSLV